VRFHRAAFVEILDRSNYPTRTDFARRVGISPGALHDVLTGRREPSPDLMRRLIAELKVPLPAILLDCPELQAVGQ
jgi:transcriptional regulator with XRE-family HTH domain